MFDLGFVIPLEAEARPFTHLLEDTERIDIAGRIIYCGRFLNRNVAMVNNSGVFGEIGKSFSGGTAAVKKSAAEGKIDTIAKGLIEKDPSMPYNMALAKAWEAHPELMAEYEDEAGY